MTSRRAPTSLRSYARAVERLWEAHLDRPVILSARDWSLIDQWYDRGVPLQLVREAIDALSERRRASPPRGLGSIASWVEESFAAIEGGRLRVPSPAVPAAESVHPAAAWSVYLKRHAGAGGALPDLLRDLLNRHDAGLPPEELDAALDERLCAAVPSPVLLEAEQTVQTRLEPFRDRMPEDAFDATRLRAVVDVLRRRLGLGRLATAHRPS